MGITSDSIGLLFRAKGDTDDAKKAFSSLRTQISGDVDAIEGKGKSGFAGFAQSMGLSESQATKLAGAMPILGAAVAGLAVGVAAVTAIVIQGSIALFNLTKQASEYGSAIFDAQQKTGLSALTLTTLKLNADNAGSSLEQVVGSISKYVKTIGAANDGNEKAQKTLKDLKVTATDLDGALAQVIKTIAEAPEGIEQMTLAQKAFGKSGADLIPVIEQMNGELEEAKRQAEFWGTTLTEKDIKASDDFGDALGLLSAQASAAAVAFTSDLMPVMTQWFTQISTYYAHNKDEVRTWGSTISSVLSGLVSTFQSSFEGIKTAAYGLRTALAVVTGGISEMLIQAEFLLLDYLKAKGEANKPAHGPASEGGGRGTVSMGGTPRAPGGGGKGGGGKSAAKRQEEQDAKSDLQAQIDLQRMALQTLRDTYKKALEEIRAEFRKTGDVNAFINAQNAAVQTYTTEASVAISTLQSLQTFQAQQAKETENQSKLRVEQQKKEVDEINGYTASERKKSEELIGESDKKIAENTIKIDTDLVNRLRDINQKRQDNWVKSEEASWDQLIEDQQGFFEEQNKLRGEAIGYLSNLMERERDRQLVDLDVEYNAEKEKIEKEVKDTEQKYKLLGELEELYIQKRLLTEEDFQAQKKAIQEKYAVPVDGGTAEAEPGGFFGGLFGGLGTSIEDALKPVEKMDMVGKMLGSTFMQMASAVGAAVKSFVLLGSAGGGFRKMAAEVIASIAQMAIVQSIFELAQGFAMLALTWFTGNPKYAKSAGDHFAAAAMFGIVGGVAAVAGRFVAGDAFKKESAGAYGTAPAGGGAGGTSGQSGNKGGVYSSKEDVVVEQGRNAPGGMRQEVVISFKDKTDWFAQMFKIEMEKNGIVRDLIQDAG